MPNAKSAAVFAALGCVLGACSTAGDLENSRTVFHNPYAPIVVDAGPVGPQCDETVIGQDGCYAGEPLLARRGRWGIDANGNRVRLSKAQRDFARDREQAIEAKADLIRSLENGTALPPDSPALPAVQR